MTIDKYGESLGFADRCVTTPPRGPTAQIAKRSQSIRQWRRHRCHLHSERSAAARSERMYSERSPGRARSACEWRGGRAPACAWRTPHRPVAIRWPESARPCPSSSASSSSVTLPCRQALPGGACCHCRHHAADGRPNRGRRRADRLVSPAAARGTRFNRARYERVSAAWAKT